MYRLAILYSSTLALLCMFYVPDASNFPTVLVSIVVPVGFIVVLIAIIVLITVVAIVCKKRKKKSITQVVYEDPDDLEMSNVGKIVLADNTAYGSKENADNITNVQPNAAYFVHRI